MSSDLHGSLWLWLDASWLRVGTSLSLDTQIRHLLWARGQHLHWRRTKSKVSRNEYFCCFSRDSISEQRARRDRQFRGILELSLHEPSCCFWYHAFKVPVAKLQEPKSMYGEHVHPWSCLGSPWASLGLQGPPRASPGLAKSLNAFLGLSGIGAHTHCDPLAEAGCCSQMP